MIPLLFIHGSWHGAWCWDEHFIKFLEENDRPCDTVNLAGDQGQPNSLRGARLQDFCAKVAEKVEAIVTETGFAPILVGHSMGGAVVQKYLEIREEKGWPMPPGVVLMASVPPAGVWLSTLLFGLRHPIVLVKTTVTCNLKRVVGTETLAKEMLFDEDMPEEDVKRYSANLKDESFRGFFDTMIFDLPHPKHIPRPLPPMLILKAENDRVFKSFEVDATAHAYGMEAVFIEGVAHDMMLSPRWRKALEPIMKFQKSVSDAT